MKSFRLIASGLLTMFTIAAASAQTVTELRITGSATFRYSTVNAILTILSADRVWGYAGTDGMGANQQIFIGTTKVGGINVIIKTAWAGSAGGIYAIATPAPAVQPFIIDPTGTSFSPSSGAVGGVALTINGTPNLDRQPANAVTERHTADVALSDVFQVSTPYHGITLKDTIVGIVPFVWVKGGYTPDGTLNSAVAGGYPGVTNITKEEAQALIGGGLALNQLTGVDADNGIFVGLVGCDHNSGARLTTILDSQYLGDIYGAPTDGFNTSILQYIPNDAVVGASQSEPQSAGSGIIESINPWPIEEVDSENRPSGSEGFSSTSYIVASLSRPCDTSTGNYLVSYLGISDANNVNPDPVAVTYIDGAGIHSNVHPSLNVLTVDGTYPGTAAHPFAPPYTNLIEGKYTFWSYEHFLYPAYPSEFSGAPKTVADLIAQQLLTEADFEGDGVLLSAMRSSRSGDGTPVSSP